MKRILLLLMALVAAATAVADGRGDRLETLKLFDRAMQSDPRVVMVTIAGSGLRDYDLDLYRSLTAVSAPDVAARMEKAVQHDGTHAREREVAYRDGRLYYGFYVLDPRNLARRYIFYLNRGLAGGKKAMVIYMEGDATVNQIKRMLKKN